MSAPSDRIEVHVVGPHRVDLEFPDVVHVHYEGEVQVAHYRGFDEVIDASSLPSSALYLLRDSRNGGFLTQETRKHIASRQGSSRFQAVLTYGASFQSKTVFENMNRALRSKRPSVTPIEFFDNEALARAWIAKHREATARTRT